MSFVKAVGLKIACKVALCAELLKNTISVPAQINILKSFSHVLVFLLQNALLY